MRCEALGGGGCYSLAFQGNNDGWLVSRVEYSAITLLVRCRMTKKPSMCLSIWNHAHARRATVNCQILFDQIPVIFLGVLLTHDFVVFPTFKSGLVVQVHHLLLLHLFHNGLNLAEHLVALIQPTDFAHHGRCIFGLQDLAQLLALVIALNVHKVEGLLHGP